MNLLISCHLSKIYVDNSILDDVIVSVTVLSILPSSTPSKYWEMYIRMHTEALLNMLVYK